MSIQKSISILIVIAVLLILGGGVFIFLDFQGSAFNGNEALEDPEVSDPENPEIEIKPEPRLLYHPADPSPGDFMVVEAGPLENAKAVELDFDFPGTVETIYYAQDYLYAIVAIDIDTEAESYDLILVGDVIAEAATLQTTVTFAEKEFSRSYFSMPAARTEGWTASRLAEDREKVRQAREVSKTYPLWLQSFIIPLEGPVTSEFGAIRVINNNPPRRHNGIDIGVEEGTPVVAPNRGIVRLAEFLLSGGNTVIIEHGLGLSSTYMHLHEIEVEEGQMVDRGELIGTVGMTGYATGPHLHWEVNIGQVAVNPEQLQNNELLWIAPAHTLE